ncbi:hypothetical protein DL237_08610 [Pseudooceanicola sediminis]|uniref:Uncharacterized protein n=1 Tax=Pseudooceanicola sediminis TaxID=2211117 RepID=A0A399J1U8_9RHOB|nr:hypothetical protein [Pseudooceanicola sediminis]KAA2316290.1 hypothetical protein E0K93_05465 [Puniceibacterium sp. HSS470]RII39201.1 hypothetical protein DL237_08610 [Pseudooceanicola sediminis]|tara:strand:- start:34202 stop:36262 length:2061 start_codon:yes stop_codon:yes gene_type:complete
MTSSGTAPEGRERVNDGARAARLAETLDVAIARLEPARPFAKPRYQRAVLDVTARLLQTEGGLDVIRSRAMQMDAAGLFAGSDWDRPEALLPQLVGTTLMADDPIFVALEAASLARFLAVANGEGRHENLHKDMAVHFLTQVLALNLKDIFGQSDEASRALGDRMVIKRQLLNYISEHIGLTDVLGVLVSEIWRLLEQRSVQVAVAKDMIAQIAIALDQKGTEPGSERLGAERLVSALFGPTVASLDDPGIDVYLDRIAHFDETALSREAMGFARAMHDTGLVSDYHAAFLVWALDYRDRPLVPEALGLGTTGLDCWRHYRRLIEDLIRTAVSPTTPQAAYGLAMLLERGVLHHAPMVPALHRHMQQKVQGDARQRLRLSFGDAVSPEAHLLAGVLQVIGQPLGVGQGANPTCQSARAISMWALIEPDFLLHLISQACEFDTVLMQFEGTQINSADLPAGLAGHGPIDADPVSVLLVSHLDRIYAEMGRLCLGREGDPHRWINPQFHGWWVARDCAVAVDVATGELAGYDRFLRRFFAAYHPHHNGDRPVSHPQPAGIAVTDPNQQFVGWHAIAILRVSADQAGVMRVYFYNPNNDSGQDWGGGVVVSTSGNGERYGEGSLEFGQFLSRVYLFHDDPLRSAEAADAVPDAELPPIHAQAAASWAADRLPQAAPAVVQDKMGTEPPE